MNGCMDASMHPCSYYAYTMIADRDLGIVQRESLGTALSKLEWNARRGWKLRAGCAQVRGAR